ncbi:MAG: hypothetical protein ACQSGP_12170 [Frankia sp.]
MIDTGAGRADIRAGRGDARPGRGDAGASRGRPGRSTGSRRRRLGRPTLRAAGATVALLLGLAACSGGGSGGSGGAAGPPATPTSTPVTSTGPAASTSPSAGTAGAGGTGTAAASRTAGPGAGPGTVVGAGYQPMFPFTDLSQADSWRRAYAAGGTQPWHLDPAATATAFTARLGLTGVRRALTSTVRGREAQVSVGFTVPNAGPRTATAAVLHLVRFGTSTTAPWEVVGTNDTAFSLTTPGYGATARSPLTVGGRITGVDESIRVAVYGPVSATPLGVACCVPAGGTGSPWRSRVTFNAPRGSVLIVLATTGGHVAAVERFAVTAVRTA